VCKLITLHNARIIVNKKLIDFLGFLVSFGWKLVSPNVVCRTRFVVEFDCNKGNLYIRRTFYGINFHIFSTMWNILFAIVHYNINFDTKIS
jgi:hypothetical protein